ncbi:hypothetical protein [Desulfovibrio falkowii]|uniref:Lipoprotein n=1 Tax=Desulfovibrio falkowii TaxID=3136602 RepID=A0ABQ0ED12_9BACT
MISTQITNKMNFMKNILIATMLMISVSACNNNYNNIAPYPTFWVDCLSSSEYFNEPTKKISQLEINNGVASYYVELKTGRHIGLVCENIPWTSLLSFDFVKSKAPKDIPSSYLLLLSSFNEQDKGSYLGANAFGVTKNVTITDGNYGGVLIIPDSDKDSYDDLQWDLRIKNQDALIKEYYKAEWGNFRWDKNIRIVAKITIDMSKNGKLRGNTTTYKTPTLDDPVKSTNKYSFVSAHLDSIVYIDKKTNKILAKFVKS